MTTPLWDLTVHPMWGLWDSDRCHFMLWIWSHLLLGLRALLGLLCEQPPRGVCPGPCPWVECTKDSRAQSNRVRTEGTVSGGSSAQGCLVMLEKLASHGRQAGALLSVVSA